MYYNLANECDIKLAHLRGRIGTEQNTLRPGGHSKGENDMKRTKKVIALALVLVMAAALLSGCGETGSAGTAASGKTYNLVYQCAWGSGGGPYQYASDLVSSPRIADTIYSRRKQYNGRCRDGYFRQFGTNRKSGNGRNDGRRDLLLFRYYLFPAKQSGDGGIQPENPSADASGQFVFHHPEWSRIRRCRPSGQ